MTKKPIEFYFEYSSPYGYLASELIEDFARDHDVEIVWKPFLMGAVFKRAGTQPLLSVPLKGEYAKRDVLRAARLHNIPFKMPPGFPLMPISACRATFWAEEHQPEKRVELIHALYREAFAKGGDFGKPQMVADIAAGIGMDGDAVLAGMKEDTIKTRLREEVDAALDRGVFGSPYFVYGDEPFWGMDHMDQLSQWIKTGGW